MLRWRRYSWNNQDSLAFKNLQQQMTLLGSRLERASQICDTEKQAIVNALLGGSRKGAGDALIRL